MNRLLLFLLLYVSPLAFGQVELDYNVAPENYGASFSHGGVAYPELTSPMTATIQSGTTLYSKPEYATGKRFMSLMPWNYWKEQCKRSEQDGIHKGKLLYTTGEVAAIRLDRKGDFCGDYFNDGEDDRRIVFVKATDISAIIPRGEEKTEAGITDPGCKGCATAENALAALADMAQSTLNTVANKACQKRPEELERYLSCHATPHQANYDKYYKKLFNLAGTTFQGAYLPGSKEGRMQPVLSPKDLISEGKGPRPFWIRANASVMKCIALRESQWNPKSISQTGAMGITQQTKVHVAHINCLLNGCEKPIKTMVRKDPNNKKSPLVEKTVMKFVNPEGWAVTLWNEFFRRAKVEFPPDQNRTLYTNPHSGKPCGENMTNKEEDAACPINSIASMAIYQMDAEFHIRQVSPKFKDGNNDFSDDQRCDMEVMKGATNNAGTGTLRRAVAASLSPEGWQKGIRAGTGRPETHGKEAEHFSQMIENCLQAGNMQGMHPPAKGDKPTDCSPYSPLRPKPVPKAAR